MNLIEDANSKFNVCCLQQKRSAAKFHSVVGETTTCVSWNKHQLLGFSVKWSRCSKNYRSWPSTTVDSSFWFSWLFSTVKLFEGIGKEGDCNTCVRSKSILLVVVACFRGSWSKGLYHRHQSVARGRREIGNFANTEPQKQTKHHHQHPTGRSLRCLWEQPQRHKPNDHWQKFGGLSWSLGAPVSVLYYSYGKKHDNIKVCCINTCSHNWTYLWISSLSLYAWVLAGVYMSGVDTCVALLGIIVWCIEGESTRTWVWC